MFELNPISLTKLVVTVTFIVALSACAQRRTRLGENETRVIPQSALAPGETWHDEEVPEQYASTKESFRARVKKSGAKSRKSMVSQR